MKWMNVVLMALICLPAAVPAQEDAYPTVHHTRDRVYDVLNYRLTIEVNLRERRVAGEAAITLVPIRPMFDLIELDAAWMTISRVRVNDSDMAFTHTGDTLAIGLGRPYASTDTLEVRVVYSVTDPPKGLYFGGPDSAEPWKRWQLYSQGESMENHYWFPCYDYPNDKATSEMIVTVRSPYVAVSNGKLLRTERDATGEKITYHWKESLPHVSYLVSLTVGEYELVQDSWRGIPVMYYVYSSNRMDVARSFGKTPQMMDFYTDLTGYPYPWEKYGHVIVEDYHLGGQENVSISTLTDRTMHDSRAHLDRNSDGLVAHELAHQWFGDMVSFRDWANPWLSEGFATYLTLLHEGYDKGDDELSYQLKQTQDNVLSSDTGDRRRPTVTKRFVHPDDLFDNRIYGKGACILNMLRFTVGDELFLKALRNYTAQYAFQSVETSQLRVSFEESTGYNLDWFFDQWVYGAGYPQFDISSRWDQGLRAEILTVRQTQTPDSLTGIFTMPVDIEVWVNGVPTTYREMVTGEVNEFSFPAYQEPQLVIFDKGSQLLKRATFEKSIGQWAFQLAHAADVANRVEAVGELRWMVDSLPAQEALLGALIDDRSWGVRREAAWALYDAKIPPADGLLRAYGDRNARVRSTVIRALGKCAGEEVIRTLLYAFRSDSSYYVSAAALGALVKADSLGGPAYCYEGLMRESDNDVIRSAALRGLARYDDDEAVLDTLKSYTRLGGPRDLRVLSVALLARNWKDDEEVLDYLTRFVDDPEYHVRRAAVINLGDSGYEGALNSLRRRLVTETNSRIQKALREAISKIEKKNE